MVETPVHKRDYDIFLSHANVDKKTIVNELYKWFKDIANIRVWYDQAILSGGSSLPQSIGRAIPLCRSMVLILSSASVKSRWVSREYSLAAEHQMKFPEFKIIPVLIDDCELPDFLRDSLFIDAREGHLTLKFYRDLLHAIYPFEPSVEFRSTYDIFVSRTWCTKEAKFADEICQEFINSGFRLVGDAMDHPGYKDSKERVDNIVSSCGGLLAVLPYREGEPDNFYTSPYC